MGFGTGRRRLRRLAAAGAGLLTIGVLVTTNQQPAFGDAHAVPPFPTNCPPAQFPPAGYFDPTPSQPTPPITYTGPPYHGPVNYEVPFKAIIFGGLISLPPNVKVPNLYASLCGLIQLPQLSGSILADNIAIATPNLYIAGLEALPASVKFGHLTSTINIKPAHNGGLDITLFGPTTSQVTTLGMTCGIVLNARFTTQSDGILSGRPVTGPTKSGEAEVVSDSFPVPPVVSSPTCPPSIAQTFNRLLGLPVGPGVGTFTAPFCFDFELQAINTPVPSAQCPWPK